MKLLTEHLNMFRTKEPNILFFTVHKAGSVFIHQICRDLAQYAGIRHCSPNYPVKSENWISEDLNIINEKYYWKNKKGCFGPLRYLIDVLANDKNKIILHLRDPRDGLTSMFFSFVYSHPRKRGFNPSDETVNTWIEEGIDNFVMERAPEFLIRYTKYCNLLKNNKKVVLVKYEEMVTEFDSWLQKVASPFDIKNRNEVLNKLYEKYIHQFQVQKEDKYNHIRKVTPGDHKDKLSKETIMQLDEMFYDVLVQLEY